MGKGDTNSKRATNKSSKRNSKEYSTVPVTDTDDTEPRLASKKDKTSKAKSKPSKPLDKDKSKEKDITSKKKKGKRGQETEDDDSDLELRRKPSRVVAPLSRLTREEYKFFELVQSGDVSGVDVFLRSNKFKGMDINKTDKKGYTVLHYAVRRQDEEMTRLLIQQPGVRLFDTLLHAIKEENEVITKMLLELYDAAASDEEKLRFVSSLDGNNQSQQQMENLVSTTSRLRVSPRASAMSTRSGVKASVRMVLNEPKPQPSAIKTKIEEEVQEEGPEPVPFDSEFPPVITPLMLAAQQGSYALMELFYMRDERLENAEFTHNIGCSCDICAKLNGDQDMTRTFQRYHLFKALAQPEYICFMCRKEKIDPVNYAIQKILKIREIIERDQAYNQLFSGFEEELEEFICKLFKLCRSTNEMEIFLSPMDAEGKERLPHLYPRLWYAVGAHLKKFIAEPNAQSVVYKIWATDDWPNWDTYSTLYRVFNIAIRVLMFPVIALILLVAQDTKVGRVLGCPVSRFLTYLGSYIFFLWAVGVQALFPYQRCNDAEPYYQIDDNHCKQRGPPNIGTEWILIVYVISFFVSILKKNSVSWYWKMAWSWYDLITQLSFVVTFLFWGYSWLWIHIPENQPFIQSTDRLMWPHNCAEIFGECFLSVSLLLASGRILRFFTILKSLGTVQIILGKQVVAFISSMFIMVVIIFAFASGMLGLYLPYKDFHGLDSRDFKREKLQDDSYHSVTNAIKTFFFVLYEHSGQSTTRLLTWNVQNESGAVQEIHHTYTENTGLFLFILYNVVGCSFLFGMLSGYFAQVAEEVESNVDVEWKFARTEFYFTFIKDTVLPPPFNLIPTLSGCISGGRFLKLLGSKSDPKSACSCRQCCYITSSKKIEKWKVLMAGYRKLILQLIFRYVNDREEEEGEEGATRDDIAELDEELAEIKAMLKKGTGYGKSSDDDEDDDDDKRGGGRGGSVKSTRSGNPDTDVSQRDEGTPSQASVPPQRTSGGGGQGEGGLTSSYPEGEQGSAGRFDSSQGGGVGPGQNVRGAVNPKQGGGGGPRQNVGGAANPNQRGGGSPRQNVGGAVNPKQGGGGGPRQNVGGAVNPNQGGRGGPGQNVGGAVNPNQGGGGGPRQNVGGAVNPNQGGGGGPRQNVGGAVNPNQRGGGSPRQNVGGAVNPNQGGRGGPGQSVGVTPRRNALGNSKVAGTVPVPAGAQIQSKGGKPNANAIQRSFPPGGTTQAPVPPKSNPRSKAGPTTPVKSQGSKPVKSILEPSPAKKTEFINNRPGPSSNRPQTMQSQNKANKTPTGIAPGSVQNPTASEIASTGKSHMSGKLSYYFEEAPRENSSHARFDSVHSSQRYLAPYEDNHFDSKHSPGTRVSTSPPVRNAEVFPETTPSFDPNSTWSLHQIARGGRYSSPRNTYNSSETTRNAPPVPNLPLHFSSDEGSGKATAGSDVPYGS